MIKFKLFFRFLPFGLVLVAVLTRGASAQQVSEVLDSTLLSVSQESMPPDDSGGRWVETNLILTNHSALPVRAYNFFPVFFNDNGLYQNSRFDDSAFFRADSIFPNWNANGAIGYDKPWEREDSITKTNWEGGWSLSFLLPPYGTLRVPFWTKIIRGGFLEDTATARVALWAFSDSIVGPVIYRRYGYAVIYVEELAPCAAPFLIDFGDRPLNNSQTPVVLGQSQGWYYSRDVGYPVDTIDQLTTASYHIVGEYSDQFVPPSPVNDKNSWQLKFSFNGAPQSIVHDTLVSTLTDCWGTAITRTPIEAYSTVDMGYCYTLRERGPSIVQFLSGVTDTIIVTNTSIFPIALSNLQVSNDNNEHNYQIASAPSVIAVHDSGIIIVNFLDNDPWQDADFPTYSATLTGVLSPNQQDVSYSDSAFSISLDGTVNVYCPYNSRYFYTTPLIKHGLHPAGIVFNSDKISTPYSTGKSFLTAYGNDDSVSDYFYVPYYDDPHFQLSIQNFDGLGSATLPAMLTPDTQVTLPSTNMVEVLTVFTGDDKQNYLTKLHWPRANDTVTMDVLALGASAPPFDGVAMKELSSGFSMWPNPASSILNIASAEPGANIKVYDLLGREILTSELLSNSTIDISKLPPGIYSVVLNSKDGPTVVEKLTILR